MASVISVLFFEIEYHQCQERAIHYYDESKNEIEYHFLDISVQRQPTGLFLSQ
jgi:hypothetical protein